MTKTKTNTALNREYNKSAYDRIEITVAKGQRKVIKKRAESLNKSVNKYIKDLIDKDMGGSVIK